MEKYTYDDILVDEDFLELADIVKKQVDVLDEDNVYDVVCGYIMKKECPMGRKYWNVNSVNEITDISMHIIEYLEEN